MQITRFTDLGLRVLMYLSMGERDTARATITELAERLAVSRNHLVKVVHRLAQLGLVATTRGKGGGMALARPADQYHLGDVVRALEDNPSLIDCGAPPCVLARNCQLKSALDDALQAFFERLNQYTLADAVRAPTGLSIVSLQRRGAVLPVAV
ncbi:Rrf2 family transcriptional regulator [Macromonas bipunctata]|uniref:Rrf2 family transcriptional regulator n=1 Tax=Macromonas bipunctata TaxID=183670 RepID=UPI000C320D1F|nr:Rrf2 family transcriptional regulator [Macromonas bipunctata]